MKKFIGILVAAVIFIVVFLTRTKKRTWGMKISENYAIDLQILTKIRKYKDGVSVQPFSIHWDRYKGDHNPQLRISCVMFNYCIFELNIYNIHHVEESNKNGTPTNSVLG